MLFKIKCHLKHTFCDKIRGRGDPARRFIEADDQLWICSNLRQKFDFLVAAQLLGLLRKNMRENEMLKYLDGLQGATQGDLGSWRSL